MVRVPPGDPRYVSHAGWIRVLTLVYAVAALTVMLLAMREPEASADPGTVIVPLVLLIGTVAAAFVMPWRRIARHWTFWLALAQLVIAMLLTTFFYSTNNAIPLLALIPVLWIAFQLDWLHTGAIVAALVASNVAFLLVSDPPNELRAWAASAIFTFVVGSLAILTQANVQALRSSRSTAENALTEAQRNAAALRAIADAVNASVMFRSTSGDFTFTNPKARSWGALMGIDPADEWWVGTAVYGPDRSTPVAPEDQVLVRALSGDFVSDQPMWIGPPGDQVAISASSRPAITEQGRQIGTVVVGHDITALIESLRAAESFSVTVAHELRTPLTSAVGYLDLLEDAEELHPTSRAFLERARDGVVALSDRLREMLEPFEVAAIEPTLGFIDLGALVEERAERWREETRDRELRIVTTLPAEVLRVPIDRSMVAHMLDAIVSNAVKFSDPGSSIELTVTRTPTHACIEVHDHGPGMTQQEQRHAFDRFYRGPTAIRQALPGFGLGLSTALAIARAHGGSVLLYSQAGHGTTVTVQLALTLAEGQGALPASREEA